MPNVDDAAEVLTLTKEEGQALITTAMIAEFAGDIRTQLIYVRPVHGHAPR
jgi:hypothetical protein